MLPLQFSSLHRDFLSPSLLAESRVNPGSYWHNDKTVTYMRIRSRRGLRASSVVMARAEEKRDSQSQQQYEIDQDKAREALSKLDQQIESFSKKQIPSPKIRAADIKRVMESSAAGKDTPELELSGSFLAYSTSALLVFTILYNVLFYTVIKPSIDGPEYAPEIQLVTPEARDTEEATESFSPTTPSP